MTQIALETPPSSLPASAGPLQTSIQPKVNSLLEQGSGASNEDALLLENNLYGVFDGASSLLGGTYNGHTGAWWASHLASNTVRKASGSLHNRLMAANESIRTSMEQCNISLHNRLGYWSTSAAIIELHENSFDYAQIGDALILTISQNGSYSLAAPYYNHDEETLSLWQQCASENTTQCIYETLKEHIEKTRLQMNRTFGVLNGEKEAEQFISSGTMPLDNIAHILCFTDGLHLPSESPGSKGDFRRLVDCYLQNGLSGLYTEIRQQEATDPYCVRYPRFKQHDDASAIAITL